MSTQNRKKYTIRYQNVSPAYLQDIREIFTQRPYLSPRLYPNESRYTNIRRLQDEDTKNIYDENWIQKFIDESNEDTYFVVTQREENRLDIIADDYYGTARYWWVIALANYIIDPFTLSIGTKLRIPPLLSLYNRGGVLSGN